MLGTIPDLLHTGLAIPGASVVSAYQETAAAPVYRLLITGSRSPTQEMLDLTRRAVERAGQRGWTVIVGDTHGLDEAVIDGCYQIGLRFMVYGITDLPRRLWPTWEHGIPYTQVAGNYQARDRLMAHLCDRCFALCRKRSGSTLYAYRWALRLGKPADIRRFR